MWEINLNPIKNVENKPEFDQKKWKTNLNPIKNMENKP